MMPIEDGQRIVPPVEQTDLCEWCSTPLLSHGPFIRLRHALLTEKAGAVLNAAKVERERVTPEAAPRAAGSSFKAVGGTPSRTWSATGSSSLVCRRMRHAKFAPIYRRTPSTRGTDTGKTSGSSKSWGEAASTTGLAARIPADQHIGWYTTVEEES